jgi:spore germination protein GerM
VSTTRLLVSPATPTQVLDTLLQGIRGEEASTGLRSALPTRFAATVDTRRGVALISASAPFLSDLSPTDQRLAIAQIVLTLTRRPGIGQVSFRVDGTEIAVPRGAGDLTAAGGTVTFDDYTVLVSRD